MIKKNAIITSADANYYYLLSELVDSIKRFEGSNNIAICVFDAGLTEAQKNKLSSKVDEIILSEWDIKVPEGKIKGREWFLIKLKMDCYLTFPPFVKF